MKLNSAVAFLLMTALLVATAVAGGHCPTCGNGASGGTGKHVVLGPGEMPCRLYGQWKVSLCTYTNCGETGHTWLRYQNVETGEVHTVGRYLKDHGGTKNPDTGEWVYPPAPISGVIFDIDLKREKLLRSGEAHAISCYVNDPIVFKGQNGGYGHGGHRANCVTHARDGWHHFTGEYYEVGHLFQTPTELQRAVARRHPEFLGRR